MDLTSEFTLLKKSPLAILICNCYDDGKQSKEAGDYTEQIRIIISNAKVFFKRAVTLA